MTEDIVLVQVREDFSCYTTSDVGYEGMTEAHYIYGEIFELGSYLRHGVRLPEGAVVLDVGANIGLFSLFVKRECPDARILAFEPAPVTAEALRRNMELHHVRDVEVHEVALGEQPGTQKLTFFPALPGNSTSHPEEKAAARELQRAVLGEEHANRVFAGEQVEVDVHTLSDLLSGRSDLDRIDLLKVDVEGAELDVLRGIAQPDWARVAQVVVEVGDREGRLDAILDLLHQHGFTTVVDGPPVLGELAEVPEWSELAAEYGDVPAPAGDYLVYAARQ